MQDTKKAFIDFLSDQGSSVTSQRMLILDVFLSEKGHRSAEELYEAVKKVEPGVGQATVYRTLRLFVDSGIALAHDFGDGFTRYEKAFGEKHHDHLICRQCGKSVEILVPEIERLQEKVAEQEGFVLTGHKMYLYGICSECRKKK